MSIDNTTIKTTEFPIKGGLDPIETLMWDLYFASRIGMGGAEYNLAKAGMIEMVQGHVAGIRIEGVSNGWCDCRWELTDSGARTDMAQLESIILRDPPLEIAMMDAALEAAIIASTADTEDDPDDYWQPRRNLVKFNERIESIKRPAYPHA